QNGTYVNRRRIRGDYTLRHGDLLNFAEYAVLFLADDSDYAGPDSVHDSNAARAPDPMLANGETVMPEAYSEEYGYDDAGNNDPVRPSEISDPEVEPRAPPVVMSPKQRADDLDPIIR